MSNTADVTNSHPFDEVPSWYDVPELPAEELVANVAPTQNNRVSTGSKGSGPIWLGVFVVIAFIIGAAALMFGVISNALFGPNDVVVGECVAPIEADNVVELAAGGFGCDGIAYIAQIGDMELRVTEVVDVPVAQMPGRSDSFWNDMRSRCEETSDEFGIKFAWPLATTDAEWEAGNRSVACVNAWADGLATAEQEIRDTAANTGMEVDEVMEFLFGAAIGNWGAV